MSAMSNEEATKNEAKAKVSVNALLKKVNQYRSYLEDNKKRYTHLRELNKEIGEKNSCLVKENTTLKQTITTVNETVVDLQGQLVSMQGYNSELSRKYNTLKADAEAKILQYESERNRKTDSCGLSTLNAEDVAKNVWNAISTSMENDFISKLREELKSKIETRKSVDNSSRHNSAPFLSPIRNGDNDIPDSVKRFAKAAGPKFASTPLRPGIAASAFSPKLFQTEMPPNPTNTVCFKRPDRSGRPQRFVPNSGQTISPVSEENLPEEIKDNISFEENDVKLPPLKPIPSRSAPVKGSKVKPSIQKSRSRANSKFSSTVNKSVANASTTSTSKLGECLRVVSKVQKGRMESRVCNSILQEADCEKKSRSRVRRPASNGKKIGGSVFEFSMPETEPSQILVKPERPRTRRKRIIDDPDIAESNPGSIAESEAKKTKEASVDIPRKSPPHIVLPNLNGVSENNRIENASETESFREKPQSELLYPCREPHNDSVQADNSEDHDTDIQRGRMAEPLLKQTMPEIRAISNPDDIENFRSPIIFSKAAPKFITQLSNVERNSLASQPALPSEMKVEQVKNCHDAIETDIGVPQGKLSSAEDPNLERLSQTKRLKTAVTYSESPIIATKVTKKEKNPAKVSRTKSKTSGSLEKSHNRDQDAEFEEKIDTPNSPTSSRSSNHNLENDENTQTFRPRRNRVPTSYAEVPLNVKMRRTWDEQAQQFVKFHR